LTNPITIIVGTNREPANSRHIAQIYTDILTTKGVSSEIIDLADLPEDFIFSALYKNNGKNEAFNRFRQQMKESQKFVFLVPEYNGSYPGVLKAFIDGMEYPGTFRGKKAALVGLSSGGQGGGLAVSHFTDVLNYCGTHVLAFKPKMPFIEKHLEGQKITNDAYLKDLALQAEQLIGF
jgi:chromate reductase, NAD(P)H dehydrogenase (quinone)